MNIYKYLLPASLAATVHVALLWFLPAEDYVRVIAVPLTPPREGDFPIKDQPVPPEDPDTDTAPVKTLSGGPTLPDIDEPAPPSTKPEFTVPNPERPRGPETTLDHIPDIGGPGGPGIGGIGPMNPGIFDIKSLDHAPRAKVQLPPEYPAAARHNGLSGSVWVEFDVNAEGRVVRAEAVRYTNSEFVESAVRAVRKWQFESGRRNGKAVPFRMTVPIEFGLENN